MNIHAHLASGDYCRERHQWGVDHEPLEPCIKCQICEGWIRPEHMNTPCLPRTRDILHPAPTPQTYAEYQIILWTVLVLGSGWVLFH